MDYAHSEYLTRAEALKREIESGNASLRIYDCSVSIEMTSEGYCVASGEADWKEAAIPGSGFMDLQGAFSDTASPHGFTLPSADALQAAYRAIGISEDSKVVLYSRSHVMWATRAWWMLHSCGHGHVSVLDGGLRAWQSASGELAPGRQRYPAGDFKVNLDTSLWADQEQVLEAIGDEAICTVNALPNGMHTGQVESPYGRPGHIRGSINVEYDSLLEDGYFRGSDEIFDRLAAAGLFKAPKTIAYCGGGISATIDAFALKLVGRQDVRVYDGSLSEWASDESLPMEVG